MPRKAVNRNTLGNNQPQFFLEGKVGGTRRTFCLEKKWQILKKRGFYQTRPPWVWGCTQKPYMRTSFSHTVTVAVRECEALTVNFKSEIFFHNSPCESVRMYAETGSPGFAASRHNFLRIRGGMKKSRLCLHKSKPFMEVCENMWELSQAKRDQKSCREHKIRTLKQYWI